LDADHPKNGVLIPCLSTANAADIRRGYVVVLEKVDLSNSKRRAREQLKQPGHRTDQQERDWNEKRTTPQSTVASATSLT
jgi:hypothetical protein